MIDFDRTRLEVALHQLRHEYPHLWPVTDGCGCREYAEAIVEADRKARSQPSSCPACGSLNGGHVPTCEIGGVMARYQAESR